MDAHRVYIYSVQNSGSSAYVYKVGTGFTVDICEFCPSGSTSAGGPVTECLCEVDTYQPQQCAFGESGDCGNPYVKVMDAECAGLPEVRMFEGNGDNEGTEEERVKACSEACLRRQTALSGSWVNFDLQGFIVYPSNGRCYCEQDNAATCTQSANGYDRYDWIGDKHCCLIDRSINTHGCTACPTDGTSVNYEFVFTGECSDGDEIRVGDVSGTIEEKAAACAAKCLVRDTPFSGIWGDTWIVRGFLVNPGNNNCWCETSLGTTCTQGGHTHLWQRYDFTSPSECTGDCAANEAVVVEYEPTLITPYSGGDSFCTSSSPCSECQGDCDTDADCAGDLKCWQRVGSSSSQPAVPGCESTPYYLDYDYCYNPQLSGLLTPYEGGGDYCVSTSTGERCMACQGDCDTDADCQEGLMCFQRDGNTVVVPGCENTPYTSDYDYCYDPNLGTNAVIVKSQEEACPACPPGTTSDGSGPVCTCQANYYGHLRYDFTDKNSLADWQAYATEIGASNTMTAYDATYDSVWWGGGAFGYLDLPLPSEYDTVTVNYGYGPWPTSLWGAPGTPVRLCLCAAAGKTSCDDAACAILDTVDSFPTTTIFTTSYTPGQVLHLEEGFALLDANVVIDLYRTGRTLIYDFTDKNSKDDWNNYATSIGATSTMTNYDTSLDALWIGGSGASATGYLELPLPAGYDTFHIKWGSNNWDATWGTMTPVTLCMCSSAGNLCSSSACTILDQTSGTYDAKTTTGSYTYGQILHVEEDFATLDADLVITLTSTPGCTACPSGSESAGGAVTECTCSVNTAKQVRTAVFDQYTLPCMNWFFEHNGNYYMYLNSASNWAQNKLNNDAAKVTTYWSALRLSQRPVQGDTSVTIIRDDFTFATGGTQRWMSAYSCCTYCHTGGSSCAYFSVDLTGTPFTMIGSSQPTCCFGWDAGPGPSQTVIGTYTATGHVGGGGGGTCIDTAGPDTPVSRGSCTWPDYTNGGTELRLMSDEDHLTICPEFEDTECVACPSGFISAGGSATECTGNCAADQYVQPHIIDLSNAEQTPSGFVAYVESLGGVASGISHSWDTYKWGVGLNGGGTGWIQLPLDPNFDKVVVRFGSGCLPADGCDSYGVQLYHYFADGTFSSSLATALATETKYVTLAYSPGDKIHIEEQSAVIAGDILLDYSVDERGQSCKACPANAESTGGAVTECACAANYDDTGDPALYAKATSAYHIDGGGWKLVRRVKSGTTWHPATDHLAGTASYGTYTTDEDSDSTFSIPYYHLLHDTTEFLFATGDGTDDTNGCGSYWLIATLDQIGGIAVDQRIGDPRGTSDYSNTARNFKSGMGVTSANWYNRYTVPQDPSISINGWPTTTDNWPNDIVYYAYSAPGWTGMLTQCNGMNVFIRTGYTANQCTACPADATSAGGGDECVFGCAANNYVSQSPNLARACGTNQDQRCPTSYSTEYPHHMTSASNVNDGKTHEWAWRICMVGNVHCWTHETYDTAYLRIDLEYVASIRHVTVWHNGIVSIKGMQVRVGNVDTHAWSNPICTEILSWPDDTDARDLPCIGHGRYVFLTWGSLEDGGTPSLKELEVYGRQCTTCPTGSHSTGGAVEACQCDVNHFRSSGGYSQDKFEYIIDEPPHSWQEAYDLAVAKNKRLPTTAEMAQYCIEIGGLYYEDIWVPVGTPDQTDGSNWVQCGGDGSGNVLNHALGRTHQEWGLPSWNGETTNTYKRFYFTTDDGPCQACPAGSSSTGGLTTECTLDSCAANEYVALGTLVSEEDRLFTRNCGSDSNCGTDDGYGNTIQADGPTLVDLGEITYNTNTNGGFTLITKMQFTGPFQAYSSYERIFASASAMLSNTYNIELLRHGTHDQLYFIMSDNGVFCLKKDIPIAQDTPYNIIWRYDKATNVQSLILNDVYYSVTCPSGWELTDRTITNNFLGKPIYSDAYFHGTIWGLHVWDRYLENYEAQDVLDNIVVGGTDTVLSVDLTCQSCPTNGLSSGGTSRRCTCAANAYNTHIRHRFKDTSITASTWTTTLAWAAENAGRVPTVSELTAYLDAHTDQFPLSTDEWVPVYWDGGVTKDYMQIGTGSWAAYKDLSYGTHGGSNQNDVNLGESGTGAWLGNEFIAVPLMQTREVDTSSTASTWTTNMQWANSLGEYRVPTVSELTAYLDDHPETYPVSTDEWVPVYLDDGVTQDIMQIGSGGNYFKEIRWSGRSETPPAGVNLGESGTNPWVGYEFIITTTPSVCLPCPTGSESPGGDATSCTCVGGYYRLGGGSILAFDSVNNDYFASRSHSNTQHFGARQWDIASNGGFSIVGKFKPTDSAGGFYEFLLGFETASGSSMSIVRFAYNQQFYINLYDPSGDACNSPAPHGLLAPDGQWVDLIWRYNTATKVNELRIETGIESFTCSASHAMVDEEFTNHAIGGSVDGTGTAFQGQIAGFYAFDRYLDLAEAQVVLNSIHIDSVNIPEGPCTSCDPGYTSLVSDANTGGPDICFYDCPAGGYAGTEDGIGQVYNEGGVVTTLPALSGSATGFTNSDLLAYGGNTLYRCAWEGHIVESVNQDTGVVITVTTLFSSYQIRGIAVNPVDDDQLAVKYYYNGNYWLKIFLFSSGSSWPIPQQFLHTLHESSSGPNVEWSRDGTMLFYMIWSTTFNSRAFCKLIISGPTETCISMNEPYDFAATDTHVYVADDTGHRIVKVQISDMTTTILAGNTAGVTSYNLPDFETEQGRSVNAGFAWPQSIEITQDGMYAIVGEYAFIRKVDLSTGETSVLAGDCGCYDTVSWRSSSCAGGRLDGSGTSATINDASRSVISSDGSTLFFTDSRGHIDGSCGTDYSNRRIRKVTLPNNITTVTQVDTCLTCPTDYTSAGGIPDASHCYYACDAGGYAGPQYTKKTGEALTVFPQPYSCKTTTTVGSSRPGYEGQPCSFPFWYQGQGVWVNECPDVGSADYPNGWCAVDVTGTYFLDTTRGYHAHWGHCNAGTETCLSNPETQEYPTYEYPDDAVYSCTVTTKNHPSTGVQIDVPGHEGQPCEFPFEYNGQWVFECQDVGSADYPNGWCSLTPSGVFSAGSTVRGHCQTQKSMCYTCTKAMHGNLADHNMPDGSECVFPFSSTGDETQLTETTCAGGGTTNYPLGWCTADYDGDYDGSGQSTWGQCAPGRCVAVEVANPCLTCPIPFTSLASSGTVEDCKCGVGTYLDGSLCTGCPSDSTSPFGSTSVDACVCAPGFTGPKESCTACQPGYYKSTVGSEACAQCDAALHESTSTLYGFTSCSCKEGYFRNTNDLCQACVSNEYKDHVGNDNCSQCTTNSETEGTGASAANQCLCSKGYENTEANTESMPSCSACGFGEYKVSAGNNLDCVSCPGNAITLHTASFSVTDCQCEAGHEGVIATDTDTCADCGVDTFKSNTGPENCEDCPTGSTSALSSTASNDCTCTKTGYTGPNGGPCECAAGYTGENCDACATDTYKSTTGDAACTPCPTGSSSGSGSTAKTDCICKAGFTGADGGPCNACEADKYKATPGSATCSACPLNTVSPSGSDAIEDCVAAAGYYGTSTTTITQCPDNSNSVEGATVDTQCTCNVGYTGPDGGGCTACLEGYYKNTQGDALCTSCGGVAFYSPAASDSSDDCVCALGYTGDGTSCDACDTGKYKITTGPADCTPCDSDASSPSASTAASDCDCNIGFFGDGHTTCDACGAGMYQDVSGSTDCKDCTANSNSAPGSDESTDCVCNEGYAGAHGGPCVVCAAGQYEDTATHVCENCPEHSYSSSGSTLTSCWCNAGYTGPDGGPCSACNVGEYKDATGSSACLSCDTQATSPAGSTSSGCACLPGYTGDGLSCSECEAGKFKDTTDNVACTPCHDNSQSASGATVCLCNVGFTGPANSCSQCGAGTYKHTAGTAACTGCPTNTYSPAQSDDVTDCVCNAGYTGPDGQACLACGTDKYKHLIGSGGCTNCPNDSASPEASTAKTDCVCNAGYAGDDGGPCTLCLAGTYEDTTSNTCSSCPLHTNSNAGSDELTDCTCNKGYTGPDGTACTECGVNHYKHTTGSAGCTACTDFSTSPAASDDVSDCVCNSEYHHAGDGSCDLECAAGYEAGPNELQCLQCPNGKYKTTGGDHSCTNCMNNSHHTELAATSIDACICLHGFYKSPDGQSCNACEAGKFNNQAGEGQCFDCFSDSSGSCVSAPGTQTQCQGLCQAPAGYQVTASGVNLELCPANTYNDGSFTTCQTCPSPSTYTSATGSTSITDCICQLGFYRETNNECTACVRGFYKSATGDAACDQCVINTNTLTTASTSVNDCLCIANYELRDGSCQACPAGEAKHVISNEACIDCTDFATLADNDVHAASSCLCDPGYTGNHLGCSACLTGQYKSTPGSDLCSYCVEHATTPTTASDSISNCYCPPPVWEDGDPGPTDPSGSCVNSCDPGTFKGESACENCVEGTYKPDTGPHPCTSCSLPRNASAPGSDSANDCSCHAGDMALAGEHAVIETVGGYSEEGLSTETCSSSCTLSMTGKRLKSLQLTSGVSITASINGIVVFKCTTDCDTFGTIELHALPGPLQLTIGSGTATVTTYTRKTLTFKNTPAWLNAVAHAQAESVALSNNLKNGDFIFNTNDAVFVTDTCALCAPNLICAPFIT